MIYDCFTFFNELELLELRLNILNDYVDTFVISEGRKTFRGNPKPMYFKENEDRFEKWLDKIVYLESPILHYNPWMNEEFQRNWITTGLEGMRCGDLIFISDVDEIWNPDKLDIIKETSFLGPIKLEQTIYYYYLNLKLDLPWTGSVAVRGIDFVNPQYHRSMGNDPNIPDCGWHFSFLGGADMVSQKIKSFSHSELDIPKYTDVDRIKTCIENGIDLFGRDIEMQFVEIDESYPEYIVANRDHLAHLCGP